MDLLMSILKGRWQPCVMFPGSYWKNGKQVQRGKVKETKYFRVVSVNHKLYERSKPLINLKI